MKASYEDYHRLHCCSLKCTYGHATHTSASATCILHSTHMYNNQSGLSSWAQKCCTFSNIFQTFSILSWCTSLDSEQIVTHWLLPCVSSSIFYADLKISVYTPTLWQSTKRAASQIVYRRILTLWPGGEDCFEFFFFFSGSFVVIL